MPKSRPYDFKGGGSPTMFGSFNWNSSESVCSTFPGKIVSIGSSLESSTGHGRVKRVTWEKLEEHARPHTSEKVCQVLGHFEAVDHYAVMVERFSKCPELIEIIDRARRKVLELFDAPRLYLKESPVLEEGMEPDILLVIGPAEMPDDAFEKMMQLDDWWIEQKTGSLWDRIVVTVQYGNEI